MIRQADNLGRDTALPAHAHCSDAAFTEGWEDARQPDIPQPRGQRQTVDLCPLQQLRVSVGDAGQHPRIDHRQHMGKADDDRQVRTAHPEQRQNDKAGDGHGADQLHGRVNEHPYPVPTCARCAKKQAPCCCQQEARQYAQRAEHDALPKHGGRRQCCQRPQCLQGRSQKQPAMPQTHSSKLPNSNPCEDGGGFLPQRRLQGRILASAPAVGMQIQFSRHSRSRPQAGSRPRWRGRRHTEH